MPVLFLMCALLSSLILLFFLPLREIVQPFTDAEIVIKSGNHKHKAAHANIFLMIEQNNTLKYKWVEYCDWCLNHPKHYRQYSILLFCALAHKWCCYTLIRQWKVLSVPWRSFLLHSLLSFLFLKRSISVTILHMGTGSPTFNARSRPVGSTRHTASRRAGVCSCDCRLCWSPLPLWWYRLEGSFGNSSIRVKQNQGQSSLSGLGAEGELIATGFMQGAFDAYKLCCSPADTVWLEVSQLRYPVAGSHGVVCKVLAVWCSYICMCSYA